MREKYNPLVDLQETQDYIHHLKHWELKTQFSVTMFKEKGEQMEVATNVMEDLIVVKNVMEDLIFELLIPPPCRGPRPVPASTTYFFIFFTLDGICN